MRSNTALLMLLLLAGCGAGWFLLRPRDTAGLRTGWNATDAAAYLDRRQLTWQSWGPAQREQGTLCISCHTVLPYAMARPTLRPATAEARASIPEQILIDSIEKRVRLWAQLPPYYSDHVGPGKASQSRATEAVLNAVILVNFDTPQGHLRPVTRAALQEAWALQEPAGGWKWQDFGLAPWESADSAYQGAALLAVKVGSAPDGYATASETSPSFDRLWTYLQRGYAAQPVMNQLYVLWASAKSPRPLSLEQRTALLDTLRSLQQSDGGWSLPSLVIAPTLSPWQRLRRQVKGALMPSPSDGCATGLVVLVLEKSGLSQQDPTLARGLVWLKRHQNSDGSWSAASLNKKRNPQSNVGRFMSDAATGYAVLALEEAH